MMVSFKYKALHPTGRIQRGILEAQSLYDLSKLLGKSHITLIWAKEKPPKTWSLIGAKRVKNRDLLEFSFQLSRLLESGVPLLESLEEIGTHLGSSPLHDTVIEIIRDVEGGKTFSVALAKHSSIFDEVFLGLVSAGEKTGKLSQMLKEILIHLKWKEEVRRETQRALRYPLLLSIVMLGAVAVLFIVLVPQMVAFLKSLGITPSPSTRILMGTTDFLIHYGVSFLVLMMIAMLSLYSFYQRSSKARAQLDSFLLTLPLYGPFLRKLSMGKFAHTVSIMFRNGVDILDCLSTSCTIIRYIPIQKEISSIQSAVVSGKSLSMAMTLFSSFSPLTIRMVKVGESSGSLAESLTQVHEYYTQDIKNEIERLLAFLEPGLLFVVGAIITWIVMAMFWPLYEASTRLEVF